MVVALLIVFLESLPKASLHVRQDLCKPSDAAVMLMEAELQARRAMDRIFFGKAPWTLDREKPGTPK